MKRSIYRERKNCANRLRLRVKLTRHPIWPHASWPDLPGIRRFGRSYGGGDPQIEATRSPVRHTRSSETRKRITAKRDTHSFHQRIQLCEAMQSIRGSEENEGRAP